MTSQDVATALRARLTPPIVAALREDRRDFFRLWGAVTGGGGLAGRVEIGGPRPEPWSRALWLSVSQTGHVLPLRPSWPALPPESAPAAVLVSPIPARPPQDATVARQWRASHVDAGWPWLVLDVDASDMAYRTADRASVLAAAQAIAPPTLVVDSGGGGLHLWWALERPLPAPRAQALHRRLAALLCGDAAQTGARPSLRLPGSMNIKWRVSDRLLICRIDRAASDFSARVDGDALERRLPTVHDWRPPADEGYLDVADVPEWIERVLVEGGGGRVRLVHRYRAGRVRPVAVPDRCPACGAAGTAWVYVDALDPRLGCHRRKACGGWRDLRAVADRMGIPVDGEHAIDPADAHRDRALEAALAPRRGSAYSPAARESAQRAIRDAARDAYRHASSTDPQRRVWVCEATVGTGKDYTMMRAVEAAAEGPASSRWDVYGRTQSDLRRKVGEWPGDRIVRAHVSPVSLVATDGARCKKPEEMAANTAKGWEPGRVCSGCEHADTCAVRSGWAEHGGTGSPRVDAATTRRLVALGAMHPDRPAWVDESLPMVTSVHVSVDELVRFARGSYSASRGALGDDYRALAEGVYETWLRLPATASAPLTPGEGGWAPSLLDAPEPPRAVKVRRPAGLHPAWPRWVYDVCVEAWWAARGEGLRRGALLWFDPTGVTLWRRTLDHLPKSTVWSNATYHVWGDLVERWAEDTGTALARAGDPLEPRYLTRLHIHHARAVRGGYDGVERFLRVVERAGGSVKAGTPEAERAAATAVRVGIERYRAEGGEAVTPRVLVATYKAIVDHGSGAPGDTGAAWCERVGATAADYYERLVGGNEHDGWECLVQLGEPNPGDAGSDAAIGVLYGGTAIAVRARRSQELLVQSEGRLRPLTTSDPQVVVAVTPRRPAHWGETGEHMEPRISEWASVMVSLGGWSRRLRRTHARLVSGPQLRKLTRLTPLEPLNEGAVRARHASNKKGSQEYRADRDQILCSVLSLPALDHRSERRPVTESGLPANATPHASARCESESHPQSGTCDSDSHPPSPRLRAWGDQTEVERLEAALRSLEARPSARRAWNAIATAEDVEAWWERWADVASSAKVK